MLQLLDHYRPTPLESAIDQFYQRKKIFHPSDIDLAFFAEDADIRILYQPLSSITYQLTTFDAIIIDRRLPFRQQKVELAHELGHVLMHVGRQDFMEDDFRAMQEWQADRFALYALVPAFMIKNYIIPTNSRLRLITHLSDIFEVPETLMEERLRLLEERLRSLVAEQQMAYQMNEVRSTYDYSYRHPTNPTLEYLVKDGVVIGRRRRSET